MRDFLDTLDDRLQTLAVEHAAATEPAPKRRRSRRRPALLGGLTAGTAAVIAAFTMVGTSAADLPILSTATTDASQVKGSIPAKTRNSIDFERAHAFGTPGGPGYVLVGKTTDRICLVVPDPATPGQYGTTCAPSTADVERDGLAAELVGDTTTDPNATETFAFILPDGAKDVRLAIDGRPVRPQIESGVITATTKGRSRITWTVDGRPGRKDFEGPFITTGIQFQCPDGRSVTISPDTIGSTPQDANDAIKKARRERCR